MIKALATAIIYAAPMLVIISIVLIIAAYDLYKGEA